MENKNIFKLRLNEKDSIIAIEKEDYETCYYDSLLYLNIDNQRIKFAEHSFCDSFGLEMYARIYQVSDYANSLNMKNLIEESLNDISLGDSVYDKCIFANGSCENESYPYQQVLFLFHRDNEYSLLLAHIMWNELSKIYSVEIMKDFRIDESTFTEWKTQITAEFEKRAIAEAKKYPNYQEKSDDEWNQYFAFLRNDSNL